MRTLKFREEHRQDLFYAELRDRVQHYLTANGFDGFATPLLWFKAGLYLSIYAGLYLTLLAGRCSPQAAQGLWAGLGLFGILVGLNLSHDAAHGSLSKHQHLNKSLYCLTFNMLGANAYLWQMRHVQSHHLFPNVDDCDADIDDNPFVRLSPHKPLRRHHRWQYIYAPFLYLFYTLVWVFVKDFIVLAKRQLANLRDIRHPKLEVALFFVLKILYLLFFIALPCWVGGWTIGQTLLGFAAMHFVSSYAFVFGLSISHFAAGRIFPKVDTGGYLNLSWSKHQVATSLDYHATRRWANWLFGGFNAHVAHHLFPNISHVHYPKISEFIAELAPKHGLPYQNTTFPKAVRAHFEYLKALGHE